ncbi:MAG: CoA transferase [Dehalococcoidia bacterium]|jgi:crotonobetainyl-CoA:carnitine CoA-transferase CaiB-like acyl-CoA transferase|nr:CoA transferase [Dehalococcoidia bacterium]
MLRVIELAGGLASQFATMTLAELGADIVKVELPGGDAARSRRQAAPGDFSFEYLNRRKRSVCIDRSTKQGRKLLLDLVSGADAVVEDLDAAIVRRQRLSYRSLRAANANIVVASISPFGRSGPRAEWVANDFIVQAMGGIVHGTGWDDGPPQKLPGELAGFLAGLQAAAMTVGAVFGVRRDEPGGERGDHHGGAGGVHFDISMQEAVSTHWTREIERWVYHGLGGSRGNRDMGLQGFPHTVMARDGWVFVLALMAEWEPLAHFLGLDDFVTHEWSDPQTRYERWAEIEPQFTASIASRGKYQWLTDSAEAGYTFAPIDDVLEMQHSPQLAARDFFGSTEVDGEALKHPRLPFNWAAAPAGENRAPTLGEHTDEVLDHLLGIAGDERAKLRAAGVTG